ncbi:hypothetical protein N7465_006600 [Penicillium sp. CMV-2018d]|nr:hypothetical protein N7465_006600 [Penicillium sp. CMV-2018d]
MWVDPSGGQANITITIKIKRDRPLLKIDNSRDSFGFGRTSIDSFSSNLAEGSSIPPKDTVLNGSERWKVEGVPSSTNRYTYEGKEKFDQIYKIEFDRLQSKSIDRNSHELSEYFVIAIDPFSFKQDLLSTTDNLTDEERKLARRIKTLRDWCDSEYEKQLKKGQLEVTNLRTKADGDGDEIEHTNRQRGGASHWKLMSLPREDELFDSAGEVQWKPKYVRLTDDAAIVSLCIHDKVYRATYLPWDFDSKGRPARLRQVSSKNGRNRHSQGHATIETVHQPLSRVLAQQHKKAPSVWISPTDYRRNPWGKHMEKQGVGGSGGSSRIAISGVHAGSLADDVATNDDLGLLAAPLVTPDDGWTVENPKPKIPGPPKTNVPPIEQPQTKPSSSLFAAFTMSLRWILSLSKDFGDREVRKVRVPIGPTIIITQNGLWSLPVWNDWYIFTGGSNSSGWLDKHSSTTNRFQGGYVLTGKSPVYNKDMEMWMSTLAMEIGSGQIGAGAPFGVAMALNDLG